MFNSILIEDLECIYRVVNAPERFDGSTIVITGCAGFLGFSLVHYFVRYAEPLGIEKLIGLDNFILDKPKWLDTLAEEFPDLLFLRTFDISRDDISAIEGAQHARFVIHGASIASPTYYRRYPIETIDANVWGLRHLLDFYRGRDTLQGFLFFSSSEIYGDPESRFVPTSEDYRGNVACLGPRACYDESKRFGETMCWLYAKQYNVPVTVARPFNNYGPGMRVGDRRLPADFAKCVIERRDIVILSDGSPTRTFCYVSDAVAGYLLCLLHGQYDYFNIGIEKPEISVRDLASIYQRIGGEIFDYRGEVRHEASHDPDYMTDNPNRRCPLITKARETLRYEPNVLIEDGVRRYLGFLKQEMC